VAYEEWLLLFIVGLPILYYVLRRIAAGGQGPTTRAERKTKIAPGPPPTPFTPTGFPFDGEVRLIHSDYGRLRTGWWKVTAESSEAWQEKVQQMHEAFQSHFGNYVTQDGQTVPRWSDRTWERVRRRLLVEKR